LSRRKPGDILDIIGPLGNGFSLKKGRAIIVAGGVGVAPLVFLAEKLISLRAKSSELRAEVLIGAKTKNHILCEKEFKDLGLNVTIATDDGSRGFKGRVTEALDYLLRAKSRELPTIYACGPAPMLKAVSAIAKKHKIPAQLSLEAHMACGIGACLGCVVKTTQGFKRVCKEGPVFGSQELIWD
jgi:dihydroorotate dehydrogenase electron transfer subunit